MQSIDPFHKSTIRKTPKNSELDTNPHGAKALPGESILGKEEATAKAPGINNRNRKVTQNKQKSVSKDADLNPPSKVQHCNFELNLDLPPKDRWKSVVRNYSNEQISDLRNDLERVLNSATVFGFTRLLTGFASWAFFAGHDRVYWEELKGLSEALISKLPEGSSQTGFSANDLYAINMGMETCAYCTSGVLIDEKNQPFLFRNLDWDEDFFRNYTLQINAVRNGQIIFKGVSFLGQVGLFTGVNSECAVCINYRRTPDSSPGELAETAGMLKNAMGQMWYANRWGASMLLRHVLENRENFRSTIKRLKDEPLISPVYFIVANKTVGEYGGGLVISRDKHSQTSQPMHTIQEGLEKKAVVQTNIDWDESSGYNKRQSAEGWGGNDMLLNEKMGMGPKARRETMVDYLKITETDTQESIFKYISTPTQSAPVANIQTIFSAVMTAADNQLMVKVVSSDEKHQGDIQSIH